MTLTIEVPATVPSERVTPLKLSEAIRLGCLIAPEQGFGSFTDPWDQNKACALGAAMRAGFDLSHPDGEAVDPVAGRDGGCPEGCDLMPDKRIIPHLNDDHRWSRERIADWLDSIGL